MLLVSHDMRLISQVAKEIWLVENQSIKVYQGEISDFKMRVRKQLKLADKEPVKVADDCECGRAKAIDYEALESVGGWRCRSGAANGGEEHYRRLQGK
ncbi:ATP-binding cassette sub-family F member 2 [Phytophthora cinnamomi]|uniref:ATP-binding cassette sub-family F member 2 n=1 Tax=Phytophthora cinnamomi TaxID=4785 RepID=UPI00355AC9BC|nr:ATP-binding cassette sub-family F member 2 [Phytophthora cinnamomi]